VVADSIMDQIADFAADARLDATWYCAVYPQVLDDIRRGRAENAAHHYQTLGRFRGYLPNPNAERPRNPAAPRSEFGGLWTDQGNAQDLVEGKLALGMINPADAVLLRAFITDGYVVLKNAVPARILDLARRSLDDAYDGKLADLKFSCPDLGYDLGAWDPRVRDLPAKALEIHAVSSAIRDAIFSAKVVRFLNLVFERPAMASQSLGFYRGSGQSLHQDTAYVSYSLPMQFLASWIAFEDVEAGAGELMYRRGSQALGEYLYDGQFKSLVEAKRRRGGQHPELIKQEIEHSESLEPRSAQAGHEERTFLAQRGDVLIWAADLAHGGKPISLERTRRSVVTHYCPIDVAPLYFEHASPRSIAKHSSGASYATFLEPPQPLVKRAIRKAVRGTLAALRRARTPTGVTTRADHTT
jgi:phytanoyl-CoA hydroxylase